MNDLDNSHLFRQYCHSALNLAALHGAMKPKVPITEHNIVRALASFREAPMPGHRRGHARMLRRVYGAVLQHDDMRRRLLKRERSANAMQS